MCNIKKIEFEISVLTERVSRMICFIKYRNYFSNRMFLKDIGSMIIIREEEKLDSTFPFIMY